MILKKNLIDKYYHQYKNNVLEESGHDRDHNVIEESSKMKTRCFYNDNNRKYDSSGKVTE